MKLRLTKRTAVFPAAGAALALVLGAPMVGSAAATTHSAGSGSNSSHVALNAQDHKFLMDAAEGGLFEVKGGWLAQTHSNRGDVKAFGQQMINDHGREARQLMGLANRLGVTLPKSPSDIQRDTLGLWRTANGRTFDCSYIPVETVDHELDIAEYKDEVKDGRNPQVKAFAARWLPVLNMHLDMAEKTLDSLPGC